MSSLYGELAPGYTLVDKNKNELIAIVKDTESQVVYFIDVNKKETIALTRSQIIKYGTIVRLGNDHPELYGRRNGWLNK